jgi:hypothetical protein
MNCCAFSGFRAFGIKIFVGLATKKIKKNEDENDFVVSYV